MESCCSAACFFHLTVMALAISQWDPGWDREAERLQKPWKKEKRGVCVRACASVRVCARACVRVCMHACACVCVRVLGDEGGIFTGP